MVVAWAKDVGSDMATDAGESVSLLRTKCHTDWARKEEKTTESKLFTLNNRSRS